MSSFSPWLQANLTHLTLLFSTLCTLGLYSVLYKENKLYRFFEHLFLGLATGYLVANIWTDTLLPKWWEPMWDKGQWLLIFALIFGMFYFFIYSKKYSWMARLIIGFFLGVASGQGFQSFVNGVWPQIPSSFKPIIPRAANAAIKIKEVTWPDAINNIIFMVILICVMSYFFFSFDQKHKLVKRSAQLGRWMMMFTFGAIFGSTIMARLALLIDRMDAVINDFGGDFGTMIGSPSAGPLIVFAVLIALISLVLYLTMRPGAKEAEAGTPEA